jgi:hypothetical protein
MFRNLAPLACLALAGCVDSPVPLDSGGPVDDPALAGTWKSDLLGDPMVATLRPEKNGRMIADVLAYSEPGPKAATRHYEIVLARFGDQRYMSIREKDGSPNYSLARYVMVNEDRFCVFGSFSDALAHDLEQKKLAGQVKSDRHMSTVALTASADQLRDYFSKRGARAFNEQDEAALVFQRVASAELPPPKETADDPDSFVPTRCRP